MSGRGGVKRHRHNFTLDDEAFVRLKELSSASGLNMSRVLDRLILGAEIKVESSNIWNRLRRWIKG